MNDYLYRAATYELFREKSSRIEAECKYVYQTFLQFTISDLKYKAPESANPIICNLLSIKCENYQFDKQKAKSHCSAQYVHKDEKVLFVKMHD